MASISGPAMSSRLQRMGVSWLLLCWILFYSLDLVTWIDAQPVLPAADMGYATVAEKFFYVSGGHSILQGNDFEARQATQFAVLDLTRQWKGTSPPFRPLSTLTIPTDQMPFAISPSGGALFAWGRNENSSMVIQYLRETNSWSPPFSVNNLYPIQNGVSGLTDPDTRSIYIPSGKSLVIYAPSSSWAARATSLPEPLQDLLYYSWAYSSRSGKMYHFGGVSNGRFNNRLYQYDPSTEVWKELQVKGDAPPSTYSHCMVSALNGTKLVMFGGKSKGDKFLSSVYVFDLATLVWTKGKDVKAAEARSSMACTAAVESLIVWGGLNGQKSSLTPSLVYNFVSNTWLDYFSLERWVPPAPKTTNTTNATNATTIVAATAIPTTTMANITASPPSMATNQHPNYTPSLEMQDQGNSPSNVYVIGGGIGGGVIAAIAAVLFIFWRRKKYHAHKKTRKRDSHDSDSLYFKPPSRKYDRHAMKPRYAGSVGYDHDDDDDYVDSVSHRNYKNSHDEEPRRPQRYNDALHEEEIQSFSPTPLDFYNAAAAATATHGITPSSAAESASTVVDECIPIADRQFPRRVMSPAASSTVLAHSVAIRGGQGCEDLVQQGHRAIGRDMNHRGPEQYPRGYPNEFSDYQENSRNPQAMVFYNSPQQMPDTIMATPEELGMYYNQALKDPQDPQFHPQPLNTPQEGSRSNWIRGLHHYQQVPQHTPGPERFNPRDPSHMRQRDELAALKGMHQKQTELQQRMLEQLRLEQEAEMENVRRRYHLNQNSFGKALDEVQALVPPTPVAFSAVKSMNRFS